jgi:hypothetical protein
MARLTITQFPTFIFTRLDAIKQPKLSMETILDALERVQARRVLTLPRKITSPISWQNTSVHGHPSGLELLESIYRQ